MINLPKCNCDLTDSKQGFAILLGGIVIALVLGFLADVLSWSTTWVTGVLVLGLLVGILNIFHAEGILFLIVTLTAAFMVNLLMSKILLPALALNLFNASLYLLTPAAIVVSLKVIYALMRKS